MSPQPAAWHPDPLGHHQFRYWDGTAWTDHVSNNGVTASDPLSPQGQSASPRGSLPAATHGQDFSAVSTLAPKYLASVQGVLQSALESGERCMHICYTGTAFQSAYAITDRRIIQFNKRKVNASYRFEDLRNKEIFKNPYSHFLWIYTHSYHLDFSPDDPNRVFQMIQFKKDTLRPILEIDELITTMMAAAGLQPLPQTRS